MTLAILLRIYWYLWLIMSGPPRIEELIELRYGLNCEWITCVDVSRLLSFSFLQDFIYKLLLLFNKGVHVSSD